jgi:hypothetical protein
MTSACPWYRSWPAAIDLAELGNKGPLPPHVEDHLPRLVMSGQNYKTVTDWPDDEPGFCLLEWDVALDPWGMRAFAAEAMVEPHRVLVAPYRFHDMWDCWHNPADAINGQGFGPDPAGQPIKVGDEYTDSHGLGCIFLPRHAVVDFLAQMDRFGFTDATFGGWYRQRWGPARVTWRVHPQHLHAY